MFSSAALTKTTCSLHSWHLIFILCSLASCGSVTGVSVNAAQAALTVNPGAATTVLVTVSVLGSDYSGQQVTLGTDNELPTGLTVTFSPNPVAVSVHQGDATSTMTLAASSGAAATTTPVPFAITATDGTNNNTVALAVTVQ